MRVEESDLLPGDVLLYRARKPNAVHRLITSATNSPYVHAAIYIGDGQIAESVLWPLFVGVRTSTVDKSMLKSRHVGVMRSQCGFDYDRVKQLREFVAASIEARRPYNLIAACRYTCRYRGRSADFFDHQLEYVKRNYGEAIARSRFAKKSYFCSAFVVACYTAVRIIGDNAQVAYPPDFFSPASLYKDPTFGWLIGFLMPEGGQIPEDDPLLHGPTQWSDCSST